MVPVIIRKNEKDVVDWTEAINDVPLEADSVVLVASNICCCWGR